MQNIMTVKKILERELLVTIIMGLRYGKITKEKAQKLSQEYKAIIVASKEEDVLQNLYATIQKYSELLDIYLTIAADFYEKKKQTCLAHGRQFIGSQRYDWAVQALKGEILYG
jgi:deoxyadenosine/deoxycytidine kinase